MDKEDAAYLSRWTVDFARAVVKIKEGRDTPGSAITLTSEECSALADGLKVAFGVKG